MPVPRRNKNVPRAAYHHGDLRRALIGQALGLVRRQGVGALSLREVARRAGVSQAAPYRHFANKDALVAAVAEEGFRALHAEVEEALSRASQPAVARLHAIGTAYVRFALAHPAHFRVMFGRQVAESHGFRELREAARRSFAVLLREIAAGQRSGRLRGTNPRQAALATWSAVHGLAALQVEGLLARQGLGPGPRRGVEALVGDVIGALCEGLVGRKDRSTRRG